MNELTICITNHNTSKFTLNSLYCLNMLKKKDIKILIRDNDSDINDYKKLKRKIKKYDNVELYRVEDLNLPNNKANLAHGIALNDLISKINTTYGAVIDSDFTFLHKNWDEILLKEINTEYPIIGTQAPVGFGSYKPGDFPYLFGFLFDTQILKELKVDFKPGDDSINEDTGYMLREKYLSKNYKGKLLFFKNTRSYKEGPFKKVICGEYYLNGYKEIFGCHFGRGHTLGSSKYLKNSKVSIYRIKIIGTHLLKWRGKREMKKWIKICKNIVNNQLKRKNLK